MTCVEGGVYRDALIHFALHSWVGVWGEPVAGETADDNKVSPSLPNRVWANVISFIIPCLPCFRMRFGG